MRPWPYMASRSSSSRLLVTLEVEGRVLLGCLVDAFVDLLEHVRWDKRAIAVQSGVDDLSDSQLGLLTGCVKPAELRWQIESLFDDEEVFDGLLDGALPFGDEGFEIVR